MPQKAKLGEQWTPEGGEALVRVRKRCPDCRVTFEGWFPLARVRSTPGVKLNGKLYLMGMCDVCVDEKERHEVRQGLAFRLGKLRSKVQEVSGKHRIQVLRNLAAVLRQMRDTYVTQTTEWDRYEAELQRVRAVLL